MQMVTGPSLTRVTFMSAPNSPVPTVRPTAAETLYRLELSVTLVVGAICIVLFLTVCRRNKPQKAEGVLTGGEKTAAYIFTLPMILAIILLIVETVRLISFEGK